MRENQRETGIDVVGKVDWGSHFCAFYHNKDELRSILVPFIKAGIEGNEACVWVTSGTITSDEAYKVLSAKVPDLKDRVKTGQVEIIRAQDWYTKKGKFDSREVLAGWHEKARVAKERGFDGLRATGDTSWLSQEDWDKFVEYESAIGGETHGQTILVLCTYSLDLWEAYQMIDVVSTHEFALIMKDGAWRQIENSERRKSIEVALEAEEKYRRTVENIHVAVYSELPDEQSTTLVLSPKVQAITGYSSEEFLANPKLWGEIILPEDRDQVRAKVAEHRRNKGHLSIQYRIKTKSGETKWLKNEANPALDADRNIVRIDGFIEDITQLKKLNEEVENRTRQLDAANRELEAFAYSVSHDLRAPLRRIDGFSEILLKETEGRLEKESARHLSRIQSAVRSMDTLIEDILRLSRLNTSELNVQQVDLGQMAEASIGRMKSANPERKVEVKIHKGLTATGDPNLLGIAMDNLLGNAWKFTGKRGSATIEFGAKKIDGRKTFFVRDNGVGFDMAHSSKIFDPFIRLHSESEFPGSGIGLALVKRIVARHGGEIWAESGVNRGATFFFVLGQGNA